MKRKRLEQRPGLALACCMGAHQCEEHPDRPSRLNACLAGLTLRGLWPRLALVVDRRATDAELRLALSKAQLAGLKRAERLAEEQGCEVWLPAGGCVVPRLPF